MLRRTVFVTWRTPSRQVDIRFDVSVLFCLFFCSQNLNDPLSAVAAGSVCINTTWVEIQPSGIPWKPPDEIYKCHQISQSSLFSFSCRDLHTQNFADFRESTFLLFAHRFFSSSENSTFGPKRFINISSNNRTVSQVNSTIFHFGWRTTTRQHLSRAPLEGVMSTTKHACTGPRNYRSGHLCCDELYSSPDELLLVKWTSVFVLKIWTTRSRRRRWVYVS